MLSYIILVWLKRPSIHPHEKEKDQLANTLDIELTRKLHIPRKF